MSRSLNFAGGGIHEVAAMRRDGVLIAGHFDSPDTADAAIARAGDCSAVWSSLNPLRALPLGRTLNPSQLTRGRRTGAEHVERHASLLFDVDPPRAKGTMSTDAEHQAALTQARECRSWLHSRGWPLMALCDSGSGAHLRAFVDMEADAESTRLVQRVLRALKQRYSYVDATTSDLPRLCRYYGTWNQKGAENVPERPWRRSAVLEDGETALLTVSQMEALCDLLTVPEIQPSGDGIARPGTQEKFLRRFAAYCERIGVDVRAVRQLGDGTLFVQTEFCLLNENHSGSSCGVGVGRDSVRKNLCKHAGCAMPWAKWARLVEQKYGEKMRLDGGINWKTKLK